MVFWTNAGEASSKVGEFVRLTTTSAPFSASGRPCPAEQVHAGRRRVRHRLVPARVQDLDYLRSDEPGSADDGDLLVL
jgi:hypothetical protein